MEMRKLGQELTAYTGSDEMVGKLIYLA